MGFYYAQILKEIRMDGNSMSLPEEAQKLYHRTTYVTKTHDKHLNITQECKEL